MRAVGGLAFVASLSFIALAFRNLEPGERLTSLGPDGAAIVAISSVAYAGLLTLLAAAWHRVASTANGAAPLCPTIIAYGKSVLGKYLPGSVFQYASRQLLGAAFGFSQKDMALSSMVEILLHVLISILMASALLAAAGYWSSLAMIAFVAATSGFVVLALKRPPGVLVAALFQFLFFFGFGSIAATIAVFLTGDVVTAIAMAGAFLAAWLVGFLVPFAPGGIGVREAALLAIGAPIADPATLLSFAALTRLITLAGDCGYGLTSFAAPHFLARWNRQASVGQ
jgi:hypothetical protein